MINSAFLQQIPQNTLGDRTVEWRTLQLWVGHGLRASRGFRRAKVGGAILWVVEVGAHASLDSPLSSWVKMIVQSPEIQLLL